MLQYVFQQRTTVQKELVMDKGIRPACNAKFAELLPTRVNSREGNTAFRKSVMASVMEDFGITLASAATHYNHSFIEAKKVPELVPLLEGLGRPEDKKGGRKAKAKVEETPAPAVDTAALTGAEVTESNVLGTPAAEETAPAVEEAAPAVVLCSVKKKADGTVVAEGLTLADAEAMVAKAKAAKKSALEIA